MKTDIKIVLIGTTYRLSLFFIVFYLILLAFLLSLGFWQLKRADEKRIFIADQREAENKKVVQLSLMDLDPEGIRYRQIEVSGDYDPQHQYLIDNQIINGQAGYFVMTPFKIDGLDKAVLVNRGWVVLNKDRRILPNLDFSVTETVLTGRINNFPSVGMKLVGAEIPTEGWPSVVQVVDTLILSKKLGYSLLPFQIELDTNMKNGYQREWKKRTVMSPEKHIGYSIQWFGLALALTVLFIKISKEQ